MAGLWEQVKGIVAAGRAPKVTLAPSAEIIAPKCSPGRPRTRDRDNPFAHYATPTEGRKKPRCVSCHKLLRRDQVEVCSAPCLVRFKSWAENKLNRLRQVAA